jgi:hypothetical protein
MKTASIVVLVCSTLVSFQFPAWAADKLAEDFQNPPASAKPQTWWHWMNGNVTKEGITADLEAMRNVGLGGAQIFNVDSGIPAGPVKFLSPEWHEMFKHAVKEANRLGLDLCVHNCAGWSSSGGPWNTPEHAMQQVTFSEARVKGPSHFSEVLAQPPTKEGFYRDIAVLAFPVPQAEIMQAAAQGPAADASSGSANANQIAHGDAPVKITLSTGKEAGKALTDKDPNTTVSLPIPNHDEPQFVSFEFPQAIKVRTVTIASPRRLQCGGALQASDDGTTFRDVRKFSVGRRNSLVLILSGEKETVPARFWRVLFNNSTGNNKELELSALEVSPGLGIENLDNKAGFDSAPPPSAPLPAYSPDEVLKRDGIVELTSRMQAGGRLEWDVPEGEWVITRVGYTPTGRKNHPAPEEATGLECDKLSREGLDQHWPGFMKKVLEDAGPLAGKTLNNALIDSYEVGGQNWSANFRSEFQRRRGYDPLPLMPAFSGRVIESPAYTERFLWDVRRTIADLFAENYYGYFSELCHRNGLMSSIEPYTGPFESLQCGAPADLVMGEFWANSRGHASVKLASSVAHIYGKTIVGAESFTGNPNNAGKWLEDPYSLKALGDLMYTWGLNRFIFHRYAMQPWTNRWPGMTMGQWGFHFERTSTWWEQGKPWLEYVTRCQFLLQQGRPVADVAYFCGEGTPVEMHVGQPSLPKGYDYDAVNADVLLNHSVVQDGRLKLTGGASYAVLVLTPEHPNMTPVLAKRIRELVDAGLTVVGPRPEQSPSLDNYPKCDEEVKAASAEVWGDCDGEKIKEHVFGRGKAVQGESLEEVFATGGVKPDFEVAAGSSDADLVYAHRTTGKTDIYFVSNQKKQFEQAECTFRVSGRLPELFEPETGHVEAAPVWHEKDGRTTVTLRLPPAGSVFVVFRDAPKVDHIVAAKGPEGTGDAWEVGVNASGKASITTRVNGSFELSTAKGKTIKAKAEDLPAAKEVSGPWVLRFPPNWGAPAEVRLEKLISWTEHPDKGVKYFSGTATYSIPLNIPKDMLKSHVQVWLSLGRVKNIAEVSLNGQKLGTLWKPPFEVELTRAAKKGVNQLQVKVTNLWPNRLIGDEQLPPDVEWNGKQLKGWPEWLLEGKPSPTGRLTFTTWHHWYKDSALLESGMMGPVKLSAVEVVR